MERGAGGNDGFSLGVTRETFTQSLSSVGAYGFDGRFGLGIELSCGGFTLDLAG